MFKKKKSIFFCYKSGLKKRRNFFIPAELTLKFNNVLSVPVELKFHFLQYRYFLETNSYYNIIEKKKCTKPSIRFLKIFFKHGLQLRFWKIFNKGLFYFYYHFYFFNKIAALYNKSYLILLNHFTQTGFFYFENIINWFGVILEPIFNFVVKKVEKKFRKKLKKKFTASCIYIKPQKRLNIVIRNLINYSNLFENYDLKRRLGKSFLRTFIEHKESALYKKKIATYNEILKKQQTNTLN